MRLATYEHEQEAEFLKTLFSHRDGSLQNTSFGLLGPDGKERLSRGGRSPQMVWRDQESFVMALERGAKKFKVRRGSRSLPTVIDLRLGLNVAASDGMPLVALVISKGKAKQSKKMKEQLAELAWSNDLLGRAHFVVLDSHEDLKAMQGHRGSKAVQVLKPDAYGQSAEIVGALDLEGKGTDERLAELLRLAKGESKDQRRHIRNGHRLGISWKSLLPITDNNARGR